MNDAFVHGFIKQCEAMGVDPEALVKRAQLSDIGDRAGRAWDALSATPERIHALMGAGIGAGAGLLRGKKEDSKTERVKAILRDALIGAGAGYGVGKLDNMDYNTRRVKDILGGHGDLLEGIGGSIRNLPDDIIAAKQRAAENFWN